MPAGDKTALKFKKQVLDALLSGYETADGAAKQQKRTRNRKPMSAAAKKAWYKKMQAAKAAKRGGGGGSGYLRQAAQNDRHVSDYFLGAYGW